MNKRMRELLTQIDAKRLEAKGFMEGENKDVEKANAILDEMDALQKEFDTEARLFEANKNKVADDPKRVDDKKEATEDEKFCKAVRSFIQGKGLVEGVGEDGGYTVPEDISTRIENYKDVEYDLEQDIEVVNVTTNKGARTFQKKTTPNVLVDIDENGAITEEITAPKFERLPFAIQDRAGFMPVSNDLVNDSDANIIDSMVDWFGKCKVNTTNAKVLAKVAEKAQVDLKDINGIKKALNVTLGQAYKAGAKIYTNDDGLNYLDTLVDANERPLLNPDPTAPAQMQLRCGTTVLPIKVLPNKVFATVGGKVPFIVGNLNDYVRKYNRQGMTIKASDVAVIGDFNAFAQNMTLLRGILRDDYRVKDADSIVNGYITVAGE